MLTRFLFYSLLFSYRVGNATFGGRSDMMSEVIGDYLYVAGGEGEVVGADGGHMTSQVWRSRIFTGPVEPPSPPEPAPANLPTASSSTGGSAAAGDQDDKSSILTTPELIAIIATVAVILSVGAYFCFRSEKKTRVPHDSQYHLQE